MSGNSEWRPISTSREAGDRLVLTWGNGQTTIELFHCDDDPADYEMLGITHWMPLPDPPLPMPA